MPASTFPTSSISPSSIFGTHGAVSRGGLESSLILNRVSSGLSSSNSKSAFDSALLALELKRHERKRNLMRHGTFQDETDQATAAEEQKKYKDSSRAAEIRERLSIKGSKSPDHFSRDLDQWIKKMKCTGATGMRLDKFRDIKVGVLQEPVEFKSPSLEPYLSLKNEVYKFKGGRDREGKFKGKGVIEFENGDIISGTFENGMRQGECRIETFRHNMRVLIGHYERDMLNGKAKITYNNDTWLEGYFKNGVLHGFARKFDEKGRLTFLGIYKNGIPNGVCWKIIKGGGCVVGRVDTDGELTGIRVAYLYPDFKTAIVGNFSDGFLESGRVAFLKTVIEDRGIKVPIFTEPEGPEYKREISNYDVMSTTPLLVDPYEAQMVEAKPSRVKGSGDGLFAKVKIEPNIVLAFYNGKRIRPRSWEDQDFNDWTKNAYRIFDPANNSGTLDIPEEYRSLNNYCASLAHKTNHSFLPNAEFVSFTHPRFGIIPCIISSHDIEPGEEIFVHYGYDLDGCPEWYEEAWLKGDYPIPDSMRDGWANNSEVTVDEKSPQAPDITEVNEIVRSNSDISESCPTTCGPPSPVLDEKPLAEEVISEEVLFSWIGHGVLEQVTHGGNSVQNGCSTNGIIVSDSDDNNESSSNETKSAQFSSHKVKMADMVDSNDVRLCSIEIYETSLVTEPIQVQRTRLVKSGNWSNT